VAIFRCAVAADSLEAGEETPVFCLRRLGSAVHKIRLHKLLIVLHCVKPVQKFHNAVQSPETPKTAWLMLGKMAHADIRRCAIVNKASAEHDVIAA